VNGNDLHSFPPKRGPRAACDAAQEELDSRLRGNERSKPMKSVAYFSGHTLVTCPILRRGLGLPLP
jgi:hypothetical protein